MAIEKRDASGRLVSLDAYRGFVMLAMASGGLALARVAEKHPEVLDQFEGTPYSAGWKQLWPILAYQSSHVEWTGCSFWDLIQPSFMFMVGVAVPFSVASRRARGESNLRVGWHVLFRSFVLVLLGVFLSSNWSRQTNFTFVNVLTQIGLGYPFLYLLLGRRLLVQILALAALLGGYWFYFFQYTIPESEYALVRTYVEEKLGKDESELHQFTGIAAHWNKHTNAAAAADRDLLNRFVREGEAWNGRKFWVNEGGYQTLNFIPSIATMLLGLMAGQMLRSDRSNKRKLLWLLGAGALCFAVVLPLDTTIWPVQIDGWDWSLAPVVKRIWTPTWAVFSAAWTFWMLAGFYFVIDVVGWRWWTFPLTVVGMNSIAMYCMSQLLKPWFGKTLSIHLTTVDEWMGTRAAYYLFDAEFAYAPILESLARLLLMWLICVWLYRQRIFIRI